MPISDAGEGETRMSWQIVFAYFLSRGGSLASASESAMQAFQRRRRPRGDGGLAERADPIRTSGALESPAHGRAR